MKLFFSNILQHILPSLTLILYLIFPWHLMLRLLVFFFFIEGHLEKLLADKKLEEEKRQEYESVIGQVK